MKIEVNQNLDTGDLLDLENHLIEVAEEAYLTERPDLDRLAINGTIEVASEELGSAIIGFLRDNIKRAIVWVDGTKVVDKFGSDNSPLDLEAESVTPTKLVDRMLENQEPSIDAAARSFLQYVWREKRRGNPIPINSNEVATFFSSRGGLSDLAMRDPKIKIDDRGTVTNQAALDSVVRKLNQQIAAKAQRLSNINHESTAAVVSNLLEDEDHRTWLNPKNWMDKIAARRFVPDEVLDGVPNDAKILIVPGGEIADAIMYNDFRGGIHVLIDDGEVSRWRSFRDEETAYGEFLRHDVHAS
jgi:hypothetical protein